MHVTLVRGKDVHRDGTKQRITRFLEYDRLGDVVQAQATPFGADMGRDEARFAAEGYEFFAKFFGGAVVGLAAITLHRQDFVVDERARALLQVLQLGGQGEIHQKARPWAMSWVNSKMPVPMAVSGA